MAWTALFVHGLARCVPERPPPRVVDRGAAGLGALAWGRPPSLADTSTERYDATFKSNVYALFWNTEAALPPGRETMTGIDGLPSHIKTAERVLNGGPGSA